MDLKQDIAESKHVIEQLRAQNQFLRTTLDSFVYPFYVINAETHIVEMANAQAYNGQLKGDLTCYKLIHGKDRPCDGEATPCALHEIMRTKKPNIVEHVHVGKDGRARNVEVHGFPIFDQQGKVVRIIEFNLDVTERVQAGQSMQALTHALGERVKELNYLYSISKLMVEPGISIDEVLQRTVDLIPPSWQYPEITCARIFLQGQGTAQTGNFLESPWKQTADIFVHGERSGQVEVYYLEEKPQIFEDPFLEEERYLMDAIGEWLGMMIERVQVDEALRESESRWRSLTETSPDHILTLDTDLNITFANFASPGLKVEELIGTPLYTYVDEQRQAEVKGILEGVLNSGTPASYETIFHLPDGGDIFYESRVTPRLPHGCNEVEGLTVSARDITARKQVEEQRQQLAALEERERIGRELHDDLAQVIAYIHMQVQTVMVQLKNDNVDEAQNDLGKLVKISQSAYDDVRRYIQGIRTRETQPSANFFAELELFLDTQHELYGLVTQVSLPEDWLDSSFAPDVETQLLRIIQEALNNVRKHAGVDKVLLLFTQHAQRAQVIIKDKGCGFAADQLLESSTEDSDSHFGLSIMRERAESVGGRLEVRSEPGEGTQIVAWVPLLLKPA